MGDVQYVSGRVLPAHVPISDAVRVGELIFLSGQLGVEPGTLSLVPGGIRAESRQALDNVRRTLDAFGCTLADVVKSTVFLADIGDWAAFNEVYAESFRDPPRPARCTIACALALGARVEIECIARAR